MSCTCPACGHVHDPGFKLAAPEVSSGVTRKIGTGPVFVVVPAIGGEVQVRSSMLKEWGETYPGLDIPATLREIVAWVKANPNRRKTNVHAFIVNWMKREQDKL